MQLRRKMWSFHEDVRPAFYFHVRSFLIRARVLLSRDDVLDYANDSERGSEEDEEQF
jgi:hypothetical protein